MLQVTVIIVDDTLTVRGHSADIDICVRSDENPSNGEEQEAHMSESAVDAVKKSIGELRIFSKNYQVVDGKVIRRPQIVASDETKAVNQTKDRRK